jgi:hypothetical protein
LVALPLVSPCRSWTANFADILLTVTVTSAPVAVALSTNTVPTVYNRDYMAVPLTVQATGDALDSVTLFYRTLGTSVYTQAAGADAFFPDPRGKSFYQGVAFVPGNVYAAGGGVEFYVKADFPVGGTFFAGSAAAPMTTLFQPTYTTLVSGAGGSVVVPDGNFNDGNTSLVFPAGSLSAPLSLSIESIDRSDRARVPAGNGLAEGAAPAVVYEINGNVAQFTAPVTLTFLYPDVDDRPGTVDGAAYDESALKMFWWDGRLWRFLGGRVDPGKNTVSATTTHFSLFALFPAGPISPAGFRPVEKAISPNGDGINDVALFAGLSGNFEIRIFDVKGRRVRTIRSVPQWDGLDDHGRAVESGAYIYQYQTDATGEWISGAIGVAR